MRHFKPRLRTKIRKSLREDLTSMIGGPELIDDFYEVFSVNMRDLGSPVHSKRLIENVLHELPVVANIVMVYWNNGPVACSLGIGFNHTLESPWVSSLRKFSHHNPNIRLYWTMIEFARHHGYSSFEFGRSSPDEGPYQFKKQWRPKETPLNWQHISLNAKPIADPISEKSKLEPAIRIWQKLPVSVATTIGPMIRQHIGL
jgi:lipid II:glycine glycyltransferase (peptidoglycan interpeptide bridge formation enzyme)